MWTDFLRSSQESQTSIIFSQNQYFLSFRHSFRERARAREEARAMTGFREQTREIPRNLVISRAVSQLRNFKKDISKIIMIKKQDTSRELQEMMGMATSQCFQKIKKKVKFRHDCNYSFVRFLFHFFYSLLLSKVFKNYSVSHEYVTSRNHNDPYNITTLRTFLRIHQEREIKREYKKKSKRRT